MTADLISTAEVGQVPASASPCRVTWAVRKCVRKKAAVIIVAPATSGKINPTTENGPGGVGAPPEPGPIPQPRSTPEGAQAMMPWAGHAMLRALKPNVSAVTPEGGVR